MEDFLKNVPIAEGVIPEAADTFSDMAFYVCESMNSDLFDLLDEAGFVDENSQVVEECVINEGFADIKDTVVNFLKGIWEKIKAFFNKVISWFKEKVAAANALFTGAKLVAQTKAADTAANVKSSVAKGLLGDKGSEETFNKCPADTKIGSLGKYDFDFVIDAYNTFAATAAKFSDKVTVNYGKDNNLDASEIIGKSLGGNTGIDLENIADSVKAKIITEAPSEKTKGDINANEFKDMVDVITNFQDKANIQKAYTINKVIINNCVKAVKSMKEKNPISNDAETYTATAESNKYIVKYAAAIKGLVSKLTQFNSAVMTLMTERFRAYHKAVYAIASAAKKVKPEATNDSVSFAALLAM